MSKYFPQPRSVRGNVKFGLYLSNYATKADLKNAAGVDTSKFTKNEVLKQTVYDELVTKVNAIQTTDTSNLVKIADYDT